MVKHAQQCSLEGKPELKSYRCEAKNVVLFFNYVHRLVGAKFDGHYIASEKFEPAQQVQFAMSAYCSRGCPVATFFGGSEHVCLAAVFGG